MLTWDLDPCLPVRGGARMMGARPSRFKHDARRETTVARRATGRYLGRLCFLRFVTR
ncbi:hypothetical protein KH5H1_49440 [Corallococcus caeni]|nr:hypothetical protein KH5H1_49440 [Corallococcus sp. KH5-1]